MWSFSGFGIIVGMIQSEEYYGWNSPLECRKLCGAINYQLVQDFPPSNSQTPIAPLPLKLEKLIVSDSDSVPHHKYPSKLKNHKKLRKPCSWIVTRNTKLRKSWVFRTTTRFFRVTFLGILSDLFRGKLTSIMGDLNVTWKKLAGGCLFSFPT